MKKTIITVIVTACIFSILFGGIIYVIDKNYKDEISELETECAKYEEYVGDQANIISGLEVECSTLEASLDDLESDVWNVMNGENYDISIEHDGVVHNWTKINQKFGFSKTSHSTIEVKTGLVY